MASVTLADVTKVYPGGIRAVGGLSLAIQDRALVVLVGPSGCGKSTTLRMVAGLEGVTSGTITIGDQVVNDWAPRARDIAMVFQNYPLYPHLTVYKNLAFSLHRRRRELKLSKADIEKRVRSAASMLGLEPVLSRKPRELSGGERQRVAVGRAIVRRPRAFLFDEPLSNLDARLRIELRSELKRLQRRLETTTIYVTHDQEEAMSLGDRVVVMKDGEVQQAASPMETYTTPSNRFVAGFIGTPPMSFLDGRILRNNGELAFDPGRDTLPLPAGWKGRLERYAGRPMVLGIRPEALSPEPPGGRGAIGKLHGRISLVQLMGDRKDLYVTTLAGGRLVGRVDARANVAEGQDVAMYVDMSRTHVFEPGERGMNVTAAHDGAVDRVG